MDFDRFEVLTFDCYGTLIDWEAGILGALRPVLERHGITLADRELLERYARLETEIEAGAFRRYARVQREVVEGLGRDLGYGALELGTAGLAVCRVAVVALGHALRASLGGDLPV